MVHDLSKSHITKSPTYATTSLQDNTTAEIRPFSDKPFWICLTIISMTYILFIAALLIADASYILVKSPSEMFRALQNPAIRYSINLSMISCTLTTILSLWVAVPVGYLMARRNFWGKNLLDSLLDVPIVLPPLVIGLSLLILFQWAPLRWFEENVMGITFAIPAVILAQFTVACAFAVRTMRATFESINPRQEQVALTLGCSQNQAFWMVILPEAKRGILTAATLSWARALGEFGPILVFAGSTRMKTEVLPTTVFLELSVGNLETAVAVSMIMVIAAMIVLVVVRVYGLDQGTLSWANK